MKRMLIKLGVSSALAVGGLGVVLAIDAFDARTPTIYVVNGFDQTMEIHAAGKGLPLLPHHYSRLELPSTKERIEIRSGSTVVEVFDGEVADRDVLNVLGAAPLVKQRWRWTAVGDGKLDGQPDGDPVSYCGVRQISGKGVDDMLEPAPDKIPFRGGDSYVLRDELDFDRQAPPTDCQDELEEAHQTEQARRIDAYLAHAN